MQFETKRLGHTRDHIAPDGSDVRLLLQLTAVQMAHYELSPGQVSAAVANKTVEEIWFVLSGRGEIWRRQNMIEEVVALEYGVCLTIPAGTQFQFRCFDCPLAIVGITTPPWPGAAEAILVEGKWQPTSFSR
jgi:mannose-6-phosphate isomerase-like protein (cupin superfamily)